jgi:hypothetical protein
MLCRYQFFLISISFGFRNSFEKSYQTFYFLKKNYTYNICQGYQISLLDHTFKYPRKSYMLDIKVVITT